MPPGQSSTSCVDAPQTPPQHFTPLHETPINKKFSGATPYTSMHYKRDTRMNNLGSEMKGKFAGPYCPEKFLQVFLPFKRRELQQMPKRMKKPFRCVAEQKVETAMYEPMIAALSRYSPGFDLVDTHSHRDIKISKNEPEIKPDVSLYIAGCRRDPTIVTDISIIDVHMEFKIDPNDDPFRDPQENNGHDDNNSSLHSSLPFENNTLASADTMGQITCYATQQLANQFRTHAFSVLICKDRARLIYWDRSGAVVTRSFSYVNEQWLATFFWRYSHSSPAVRGIDESVTAPADADSIHVQKAKATLWLDDETPLFKFTIYGEDEGDVSYCFGNKPWFKGTGSPTGRATRVFTVYSPDLDKPVLMKDTWRVSLHGIQTEGAIYRRLHAANVSHIAHFVRGGDVTSPFCRTRSHKFAKPFGLQLRPHSHYRFILDDIGRDLTSFTTTKELVETLTDALQAHTEAIENAKILHRDISVGNIIISDRGGLLIDWDLAKDIDDLGISRQPFRTGTWQFIAARLLQARESVAHIPADDWESFFHVLSWVVLRFTRHGLTSAKLMNELRNTYDDSYLDGGKVYGGENKMKSIKSRFISTDTQIPPGPLLDLLKDLVDICAVRYEDAPTGDEKDEYDLLLLDVAQDPSLMRFIAKHPIKQYYDRKERLKASWMLSRFRDAVNSWSWDLGPDGQRRENALVHVDEVVITTKRPSEFETDIPRQNKRFKPTVDSGDNVALYDEEELSEGADSEDEEATDEHELDDYVEVGRWDEATTDWEGD